jgi:CTP synthase
MQMAVIEAARHLAGVEEANSTEFGPTPEPVVGLLTEWLRGNALEQRAANGDLGGSMRLGAYQAELEPGSKVAKIYGDTAIAERHRHRYEVNMTYRDRLEDKGLRFSGVSPDGLLPEIVELQNHPWFIGVQFHPELKSRPSSPTPVPQLHRRSDGAEPAGVGPRCGGFRRAIARASATARERRGRARDAPHRTR